MGHENIAGLVQHEVALSCELANGWAATTLAWPDKPSYNDAMDMSVLAGQHEHRKLPRGPGLVLTKSGILRDQLRPQLGAGCAG